MFARRLQIQERLTNQIANAIQAKMQPLGVGVVIEGRHLCMVMRGVEKESSQTVDQRDAGLIQGKSQDARGIPVLITEVSSTLLLAVRSCKSYLQPSP